MKMDRQFKLGLSNYKTAVYLAAMLFLSQGTGGALPGLVYEVRPKMSGTSVGVGC